MTAGSAPRALFLGSAYAGHATRFAALQRYVEADDRLIATFQRVSGWHADGRLEAMDFLPRALRGRVRATLEASMFARPPRPDLIWTSVTEVLMPYLWSQLGPLRRPLVLDLDSTWSQLDAMARHYKGRGPRTGLTRRQAVLRERMVFSRVTLFTPWSEWAASGLRDAGIPDCRIQVIPPGVDLTEWKRDSRPSAGPRLRLLFVGGDFVRKGGDTLLELMKSPLGEQLELDIVTRDEVDSGGQVRVHRLERGDARWKELYERADLFVMPSRAECFGIAAVEAMANALPVLISNVGAAGEIVEHGTTGWLVDPTGQSVASAVRVALSHRDSLVAMGIEARRSACSKFSAGKNHSILIEAMLRMAADRPSTTCDSSVRRQ